MADQQPTQQQPLDVRGQAGIVEPAARGAEVLHDEQRGGAPGTGRLGGGVHSGREREGRVCRRAGESGQVDQLGLDRGAVDPQPQSTRLHNQTYG